MTLFKELNRLMLDYNFYPSKKKAQNFVIAPDFVLKLVALANLQKNDVVLEVGAGTGFLTRELIKHCNVIAVELDDKLCVLLKEKFITEIEEGKLVLLEGNEVEMALKIPLVALKGSKVGMARNLVGHWRLIGWGEAS